jgi:hypothetical protein
MKEKLKHIKNNIKKKEIIRWMKLRAEWMFMDSFLSPIHKYSQTPIELHVGSVANESVKFIPVLFLIIADTKEANDIVGIKGAPNCKMKCRMCTSLNLLEKTYVDPYVRRKDDLLETQQRKGQHAWLNAVQGKFLSNGQKNSLE